MSPSKQWSNLFNIRLNNWFKVFLWMSVFTFLQVPVSEYAFAGANIITSEAALESHMPLKLDNPLESDTASEPESTVKSETALKSETQSESDAAVKADSNSTTAKPPIKVKKKVYLTIDDGPGGASEKILDILARYEVKATFFVLEPRVRTYSQAVRRMTDEGHQLGIHGVTHNVKRFYATAQSVVSELDKTKIALKEVTGQDCQLARTPYGSSPYLSKEQDRAAAEAGYILWDWNVDSRDWYYRDEDYVQSTIKQVETLAKRGAEPVILIHELETTAKHLTELIEYFIAQDYEFRTLEHTAQPVRFL